MANEPVAGPPPKTFEMVTTAQVERTYVVQAKDDDQARKRLRTHIADADMLREGVVVEQPDKQIDSTAQKIKSVTPTVKLAAVEPPPGAETGAKKPAADGKKKTAAS